MPNLYIIAGCNGAGKTTASKSLLPELLHCKEFVNADAIAAGLSPFQPDKVSFQAGRIMLERINQLAGQKIDFAFETTLSTKSYVSFVKECKKIGYEIVLLFFWLNSPELAIKRIKQRVSKGGHHIPDDIVKRRYSKGLENLQKLFIPIVDRWFIFDNSENLPELMAKKDDDFEIKIYNEKILNIIKNIKR